MVKYIKKTITISEEHNQWIIKNSINLSRYMQKALDKEVKKNV